jgi:DNA-binding SARP family transcriptional activator/tetratricopeptide (TPR) repeat protein
VDLLGPFAARLGQAPVAIPGGRSGVLLATLALSAGQPVSVDALADHVWGERLPERVRASLQTLVFRLRRAVGVDAIRTLPSGYLLDIEPDRVDVLRFRRWVAEAGAVEDRGQARRLLDEALRVWRGEPMSGLAASAFDHHVARLHDERLAALERRVDLDLADGRHAELVGELSNEASRHPLREPLWYRLITALWGCGRHAEAIEAYHRVREHLSEELGVDPSADLQELYRRLLVGVERPDAAGLDTDLPLAAGATPAPAPPMQRPADTSRFTGRREELEALHGLLAGYPPDPATSLVVALVGSAGAGKTALAVHWAHQVSDRFTGGNLHVDLHGYDPASPTEPATALDSFLRALGMPAAQIPADLDSRSALFRTVTTGKGLLVVADNARDADHVRPLLPGPGNLVIVTSRSQLRGLIARDDAHRITVGRLTTADAVVLLSVVVGQDRAAAEPAAVADLVGLCDRLPLALMIAAERATRQPDVPLGDLAEELRDEGSRLDSLTTGEDIASDIRAVFSWSYRHLDPDVARTFRLLGLHPGSEGFDLAAAAALARLCPSAAREHLDRLVAVHLLERLHPDRYTFHDLVRAYAAARSRAEETPGEQEAAETRVLDWYVHTAVAAVAQQWYGAWREHQPIERPALGAGVEAHAFDGPAAARRWLDGERETLVTVAGRAAERGRDAHACQLVDIVRHFLLHHSHWHDLARLLRVGLPVARRAGDRVAEADFLRDLGIVDAMLRDYLSAKVKFQESLELSVEVGYEYGQMMCLRDLANACNYQGRSEEALAYRRRELEACRRIGDRVHEAFTLNSGAMDYIWLGRPELALAFCQQAVALLAASNDARKLWALALTLDTVGQAYAMLGRHDAAIPKYCDSMRILEGLGDHREEARVRLHLGQSLHRTGDVEAALVTWRHALDTLVGLRDPYADDVRAEIAGAEREGFGWSDRTRR